MATIKEAEAKINKADAKTIRAALRASRKDKGDSALGSEIDKLIDETLSNAENAQRVIAWLKDRPKAK